MVTANAREQVVSTGDPKHHVTSMSFYVMIFFILMALTGTTVVVAFFDLGPLNTPVALAIAAVKATLVILYFMHVRHSTRLTWVVIIGALVWLGVLFVLTLTDYLSRGFGIFGS